MGFLFEIGHNNNMSLSERLHRWPDGRFRSGTYVRRYVPLSERIPRITFPLPAASNPSLNAPNDIPTTSYGNGNNWQKSNILLQQNGGHIFGRHHNDYFYGHHPRPLIINRMQAENRSESLDVPQKHGRQRRTLPHLDDAAATPSRPTSSIEAWMLPTAIGE